MPLQEDDGFTGLLYGFLLMLVFLTGFFFGSLADDKTLAALVGNDPPPAAWSAPPDATFTVSPPHPF